MLIFSGGPSARVWDALRVTKTHTRYPTESRRCIVKVLIGTEKKVTSVNCTRFKG